MVASQGSVSDHVSLPLLRALCSPCLPEQAQTYVVQLCVLSHSGVLVLSVIGGGKSLNIMVHCLPFTSDTLFLLHCLKKNGRYNSHSIKIT